MCARKVDLAKDPNWKRHKAVGRPVSKKTILKELGHPETWAADFIRLEFEYRLRRNVPGLGTATELDIHGIKTYIECLERVDPRRLGIDSGLVSAKKNAEIASKARAAVKDAIEKQRERLLKLERDPVEIENYLALLRRDIMDRKSRHFESAFPGEHQPSVIEELRAESEDARAENDREIAKLQVELGKYQKLLTALRLR